MNQYIRDYQHTPIKTSVSNTDNLDDKFKNISDVYFKIFHLNIRSISKNFDELSIVLESLKTKFEIIILSETWQIKDIHLFHLDGYEIEYSAGTFNQNDGVVMFIKNTINYKTEVINIMGCRSIKATLEYNNKTFLITSIYRPPSTCATKFVNDLKKYLDNIATERVDYNIIAGDININIKSQNEITDEYLDTMSEYDFVSAINEYTRIQSNSQSCIDHFFIKTLKDKNDLLPIILKTNITDHFPIMLSIPIEKREINLPSNNIIQIIDKNKLKNNIKQVEWGLFHNIPDINTQTNWLIETIQEVIKQSTNTISINHKKRKRKSWITQGLVNSVNKRDKLYQKLQKNPTDRLLKEQFATYRNRLNELIKHTKANYYKEKISGNKNNSKNLWNIVKEFNNKNIKHASIKDIKSETGEIVSTDFEKAMVFNKYFSNVGKNLARKIVDTPSPSRNRKQTRFSFFLKPTNKVEVIETIMDLKNNKAPGIDGIKAETLKEIANEISEHLANLINKIFDTGKCPSAFKKAVIKPIYKKGDKTDPCNYRPVSLITNLAKVFEKIFKKRIVQYVKKFNLLSDMQFGFKENISTQDAISQVTTRIYTALDQNRPSLGIFLDLAKAFDTVSHTKLLESLEDLGFRGKSLNLFKNYINDRVQCCQINYSKSNERVVEYGVPQGTVLGPILFSIYVNNLFNLQTTGTIISFADDTVVIYQKQTWAELKSAVEKDFVMIKKWFDSKLLTINFEKTLYLPFACDKRGLPDFNNLQIKYQNLMFHINQAETVKYLGVTIDRHLRWDHHINNVVETLRSVIYKFKNMRGILDTQNMKILYYALVESRLTYGMVTWGSAVYSYLKRLEIIQKKFLKIIFQKNITYPSDQLYKESKILDMRQLYFLTIIIFVFKHKNTLVNIEHNYHTRYRLNSHLTPTCQKSIGQRNHIYLAPRLYNSLPENVKNSKSIMQIKKKTKKYLLSTDRTYIHNLIEMKT